MEMKVISTSVLTLAAFFVQSITPKWSPSQIDMKTHLPTPPATFLVFA